MSQTTQPTRRWPCNSWPAPLLPLGSTATAALLVTGCGGGDGSSAAFAPASFTRWPPPHWPTRAAMAYHHGGLGAEGEVQRRQHAVVPAGLPAFFITATCVRWHDGKVLAGGYVDINNQPIIDKTVAAPSASSSRRLARRHLAADRAQCQVDGGRANRCSPWCSSRYTTWAQDGKTDMYGKSCLRPSPC